MNATQADLPAELIDLQTRFAFQEDVLQAINNTLMLQQRQIDALERRCLRLEQHCEELVTALEAQSDLPQQPPPHY